MKATIEIPDHLYRRVKAKSAMENYTIREVAVALFKEWTDGSIKIVQPDKTQAESMDQMVIPGWYGGLRKYAANARGGRHNMESIRKSIGKGIARERRL